MAEWGAVDEPEASGPRGAAMVLVKGPLLASRDGGAWEGMSLD